MKESDQMYRNPKWDEKTKKCFLEKVDLKIDNEGYIMEISYTDFAFLGEQVYRYESWEIWRL